MRKTGSTARSTVLKKLAPGAPGTRRLLDRFGAALVCVRYRDDPAAGRRMTTVELIVDSKPLQEIQLPVRVGIDELELRARVKAAGGTWDAKAKVWHLSRHAVKALRLKNRVVKPND